MKVLNLECDRFGSDKVGAKTVKSFSQFYYTLTADYEIPNELSEESLEEEKTK